MTYFQQLSGDMIKKAPIKYDADNECLDQPLHIVPAKMEYQKKYFLIASRKHMVGVFINSFGLKHATYPEVCQAMRDQRYGGAK